MVDSSLNLTNSGTFEVQLGLSLKGGGSFTNTGTFFRSAALPQTPLVIDSVFTNATGASVNISTGEVQFKQNTVFAGTVTAANDASLVFSGDNTYSAGTNLGAGTLLSFEVGETTLNGGTFAGDGLLRITNDAKVSIPVDKTVIVDNLTLVADAAGNFGTIYNGLNAQLNPVPGGNLTIRQG